ncbi:uncharacterized protein SCHCODRAFT_054722 [Schizophyllum commune H4-8]|uniref:Fe2OG dioxygenase domain-containing protein n=1 Tax=Schizophyllum commune (strain H4-8 / FGSC 9210) TaxID=578458 RepID=D8Q150_SCHCM|nr:uncharacterized protein SCHCODRAFT_054722 [Schizophyllum commune H4-8]KAI5895271.1 hypothetical protein SCHCODRAFT_054722 [Schizophyllum commune H4-8]
MSQSFNAKLAAVQSAISNRPPFVSGTLDVPEDDLKLYFGDVGNAQYVHIIRSEVHADLCLSCINLGHATPDELAALAAACQPATFGVNKQDVLDESYRKAGKLDNNKFASLLKLDNYGLIDTIRDELLQEGEVNKGVKYEVYKVNVYGKDSFFKPHKDTPRSKSMFGSLVIVFPTPHEGGALVLREGDREWTFDYAAELAPAPELSLSQAAETDEPQDPKIAYIAFFGDIEHEVLPVTAGHRVTLTYNLYFDAAHLAKTLPQSVVDEEARLRTALQTLLQDPALLPKGGYLAFGLRFMYPLDRKSPLQGLIPHMKGIDARIVRVCRSLGLEGQLKLVYEDDTEYEGNPRYGYYCYDPVKGGEQGVKLLMDRFVDYSEVCEGDTFGEYLLQDGAQRVRNMGTEELHREDDEEEHIPSTEALWVTELTKINRVENHYGALFLRVVSC